MSRQTPAVERRLNPLSPAEEKFLQPGELWFGKDIKRIRTILGSCVALTLWHPGYRIGGMCHYMLPDRSMLDQGDARPDGRYATEAFEMLAEKIRISGTRPDEYEAKLFGGGKMFNLAEGTVGVPDKNVSAARLLVARHGFKVFAEHLGGSGHRHVILDTNDGQTWLKYSPLLSTCERSLPGFAPPSPIPRLAA